jgi:single-stranded DNA-binding protein
MPLPTITGEFGIVADPEIRFGTTGSAWLKVRGIAKDRKPDGKGGFADGDPLFIDIVVNHGAENLYESVVKGDSVIVTGKLKAREHEGKTYYEIRADSVGVSTRWNPAKTAKSSEKAPSIDSVAKEFDATIQPDEAPF